MAAWLDEPKYPGLGYGLRLGLKGGDGSGEFRLLNQMSVSIANSQSSISSLKYLDFSVRLRLNGAVR
jgi:hypothetical protein